MQGLTRGLPPWRWILSSLSLEVLMVAHKPLPYLPPPWAYLCPGCRTGRSSI